MTNLTRKQIYRRDGFQCVTCGSTVGLQIHHFIPRSRGGQDIEENLVTLCWKCHASAHGVRVAEYPDYITPDWIEVHVAEYLAEYYVCQTGQPWYPWDDDIHPRAADLDAFRADDMTEERAAYLAEYGLKQIFPGG